MNYKRPVVYIPAALALIMILSVTALLMPNERTPARIHSMQGAVEADTGRGYAPAVQGMELDEADRIRTGADAQAIIVLYEQAIVRLAPGSEVSIAELDDDEQRIVQEKGSVWSKVVRLGGIDYTVQTPTATATVRGTSFRTTAGNFTLLVASGMVNGTQDRSVLIGEAEKVISADGKLQYSNLSAEDLADIREQLRIELQVLRELRLREVLKNDVAIKIARSRYSASDADIEQFFIDIDEGRRSEDDIRNNAPLTPSAEMIFQYNAEIKRTLQAMAKYEQYAGDA